MILYKKINWKYKIKFFHLKLCLWIKQEKLSNITKINYFSIICKWIELIIDYSIFTLF